MFSDQPITSAKDDLLGRAAFAGQIASAMLDSPAGKHGSFVIGLCGRWGSGKTSVINMVSEILDTGKKKKPIVIPFNPWEYPAEELLPGQLLQSMADELARPSRGEKLNKAAKAVEKYASALEVCSPTFVTETVAELRGEVKKKKKKKQDPAKRVTERKEKVFQRLSKQKRKIYIIMDDLDRLPAQRIRQVLQLIKAVAGFPHVVYLLSFDQDVVVSALSKELYGDGRAYLEKFIQLQFDIPAPEPGRIRDILMAYISAWLQTQQGLNFDQSYFDEIAPLLFSHMHSIRDIYRFINSFRVRYQALENEVNFVDLLAITVLQLHVPKALPWLQAHRDELLRGGGLAWRSAQPMQQKKLKEERRQAITALQEEDNGTLVQLIGHMFPRYGKNILDVYTDDADPHFVRMRRICCEEFFDLYFTQSTGGLLITQRELLQAMQSMDETQLRTFTDSLTTEEKRSAFLNHLPHYLEDIPRERLPLLLREVLYLSRLPEGKTPTDKPFQRSFFQECCYAALRILSQMPKQVLEQSVKDAVETANKQSMPILITLLTRIRHAVPDADTIALDKVAVTAHLRKLMDKVHLIGTHENWLTSHKPLPVLEYWQNADAVSFRVHFEKLMQDDTNAARLVSCLTQRFDQGEDMEYQYGDMDGLHAFSDLFPQEDAKAAIGRLRGTGAFRALPEDVRLDCAAFSLMDAHIHRITQREVMDVYPDWMEESETTGD